MKKLASQAPLPFVFPLLILNKKEEHKKRMQITYKKMNGVGGSAFKATKFFLSAHMHLKNPVKEELMDLTNFLYRMNPANKMSMTYVFLNDEKFVDMNTVHERLNNLKLVHHMSLYGWDKVNPDISKALKELQ